LVALIVYQSAVCLMTPPYLPLVASVPRGTPATLEKTVLEVREASDADGASLGAIKVEVDWVGPRLDNDTGGSLHDWVMHGAGIGVPGSVAPGP
jgi:hypothetical protein